jgi:uncharacterized protein
MTHAHRFLLKWARFIHVYLTMFAFLVILFFAATGFMLNHPDWFQLDIDDERTETGNLPSNLLEDPEKHKLEIVEALRKDFRVSGFVDSFDAPSNDPIAVKFKSPGQETDVTIQPEDGQTSVTFKTRGIFILGLLTDLHRGEGAGHHSGPVWAIVIDAVAILLLVISLTGLILWTSLRTRGNHGLTLMGLGALVGVVVYFVFVP